MNQHSHLQSIVTGEVIGVALGMFRQYKVRFSLTALGVALGTASLVLVVTIGLTGKEYILDQIRGIGANMIRAFYEGDPASTAVHDYLTTEDMRAVQQQVPSVVAASPLLSLTEVIPIGGGKVQEVRMFGVDPQYQQIRNLDVLAGRFFDDLDSQEHAKVADLTETLAKRMFGSSEAALGRTLRISGLPFTVIGTFKERVETFGQSELAGGNAVLIPYSVCRYFIPGNTVHQLFFSVADPAQVEPATQQIQSILHSRHRPESVYRVENLTQLLSVAAKTANALTVVLLLVAMVTLVVGGMGIMNIMLATVTARTYEIGLRKAVGATAAEIRLQFLAEAVLISLIGGVIGIAIGLALPLSLRVFTSYDIPISGLSVIVALASSSLVGIVFGTAPAARAAHMDPIQSLRYQ
ncbi:MAG: ABC transporter permease [Terriglobales bacterium]